MLTDFTINNGEIAARWPLDIECYDYRREWYGELFVTSYGTVFYNPHLQAVAYWPGFDI